MKIWRCFFLIGLLTTLVGLVVNLSQQKDYQCVANEKNFASNIVTDKDGNLFQLPFTCQLEGIISENYPSGATKSHTATVICCYYGNTDTLRISENHPASFYQYDFLLLSVGKTLQRGSFAEFQISTSSFTWVVYTGLFLLIISTLAIVIQSLFTEKKWRGWFFVIILMVIVFIILLIINPMMRSLEVPPILRSVWFIPHVVSYIIAYALLLFGWFTSIYTFCKPSSSKLQHSIDMLESGTAFYTIGLALGIIWAKSAWGSFWNWDPKETMALIAYGYCLSAVLILRQKSNSASLNLIVQSIGIILMIVCWLSPQLLFGHLESMHSY